MVFFFSKTNAFFQYSLEQDSNTNMQYIMEYVGNWILEFCLLDNFIFQIFYFQANRQSHGESYLLIKKLFV